MEKKSMMLIVMSLTFCFIATAENAFAAKAEKLLGLKVNDKGIEFIVSTGGCTQKSNFSLIKSGYNPINLMLKRNQAKNCYGYFVFGKKVFFSFKELGIWPGDSFIIENEVSSKVFHY